MNETSQRPESKTKLAAGAIFITLICVAVYIPAIRGGFLWDDDSMLTENIIIEGDGLYQSWFTTQQPNYWPITWTSYWMEYKLWGLKPVGYHVVNVLIHAVCAVLIWRILIQLNIPAAFAAAIIFAVHPVNVESVAWIAQQKTVLAMLFFLPALYYYLRFDQTGRRIFYALSVVLFISAMLSKGSVIGLPVVILLCVWWLRGTISRRDIIRSMPFFAVSAAMSVVEIWFQYNRAIAGDFIRSDSFLSRLAGAGWAVWFYLYKAVLPVNLAFIYPLWKIDPANIVSYIPGLLLIILLALAWRYRRGWGRPVFFALSFYIVMLLPVLGFFTIYFMRYSPVADHYQYVSIIGLISFTAAVCYGILGRYGLRGANTAKAIGVLAAVIFAISAWRQCRIYRDIEILWSDTLQKNPDSWVAHNEIGSVYKEGGRFSEAKEQYRKAIQIKPDYVEAYNNLGTVFQTEKDFGQAIECYLQAIKYKADSAETHSNFGAALQCQGRLDEAIGHFRKALDVRPDFVDAHIGLALALHSQGKIDEAISQYQQVLRIKPDFIEVYDNLAAALVQQNRLDEAVDCCRKALRIKPDSAGAYCNLGIILGKYGKLDEAANHFRRALRLKPDYADACYNLGRVLQLKGSIDEAAGYYRQAINLDPNFAKARNNLGAVLLAQGKLDEAVSHYRRVLEIEPKDAMVLYNLGFALLQQSKFDEAADCFRQALQINPDFVEAKHNLEIALKSKSKNSP